MLWFLEDWLTSDSGSLAASLERFVGCPAAASPSCDRTWTSVSVLQDEVCGNPGHRLVGAFVLSAGRARSTEASTTRKFVVPRTRSRSLRMRLRWLTGPASAAVPTDPGRLPSPSCCRHRRGGLRRWRSREHAGRAGRSAAYGLNRQA